MRLSRFHLLAAATLIGAGLIAALCHSWACFLWLGLLFTSTGLIAGLGVAFPEWQMFGESICRVKTSRRAVAFTFDDGPNPQNTPPLLELLAKHSIKATFFCVGKRVASHPELVRSMASAGHQIENHSYEHSNWTNFFPTRTLHLELSQTQDAIERAAGRAPVFYRPPMGLTNPATFQVARHMGLTVACFSARGFDRRSDSIETIAGRILRKLQPGAIVLLHDHGVEGDRLLSLASLLIEKCKAQGYEFLRLDELIAIQEKSK